MNYKESNISGIAWTRCRSVSCLNPLDGVRKVLFQEERAMTIDGVSSSLGDTNYLSVDHDQNGLIDLVDPTTGASTGATMTHNQLYQALFSLYRQSATARDQAP